MHAEWDLPNPLESNYQLSCVTKGIKRQLGDSVSRKSPITPEILLSLLRHLDLHNEFDCNFWAICLCAFFCMLRRSNLMPPSKGKFDPVRHLRRCDILFRKDGVFLHVRWTKTIQFRDRTLTLPLPRIPNSPLCPSQAIYMALSKANSDPRGPAFVLSDSSVITVTQFIHKLKHLLERLGLDASAYAGHSFRRGGASWAFQKGVSVETIRQIGDWRSQSYQKYLFDSKDTLKQAMLQMSSQM